MFLSVILSVFLSVFLGVFLSDFSSQYEFCAFVTYHMNSCLYCNYLETLTCPPRIIYTGSGSAVRTPYSTKNQYRELEFVELDIFSTLLAVSLEKT